MKRALYSTLEIGLASDDVIRWRCGQLLSRYFMVYYPVAELQISEVWVIDSF